MNTDEMMTLIHVLTMALAIVSQVLQGQQAALLHFTQQLRVEEDDSDDSDDDIDDIVLAQIMEATERQAPHRIPNYFESVVPNYTEEQFRRHFRMSRKTMEELCAKLERLPGLQRKTNCCGKPRMEVKKMLYITIWYLANGSETYRQIADRFDVCEATVRASIKRVTKALTSIADQYIQWPNAEQQRTSVSAFQEVKGFPGVIGAIDGTHIPIKCPTDQKEYYCNRKKYTSLLLQVICDHRCRFVDCFSGVPGSRHDAKVFDMTDIGQRIEDDAQSLFSEGCHILGDKAYKLSSYVLTPFRFHGPLTPEQVLYNKAHSATRMAVERAIGILKGRFRRLMYKLDLESMETMVEVIMACCVLHNIALASDSEEDLESFYNSAVQEQAVENHDQVAQGLQQPFAAGTEKRRQIVENLARSRH